jgi:hypothetical protein
MNFSRAKEEIAGRRESTTARLLLFGGVLGRSGFLFSGGKGLNPLVLSKAFFPLPQPHTTFVISHNVRELNPIPEDIL